MEYEIIQHSQIQGVKLLLDDISYRTPHMHREFEAILVLSGTLLISCLNEQVVAEPGDMVILNPWKTHEFHTRNGLVTCLIVQVQPEVFRGYFPAAAQLRFQTVPLKNVPERTRKELLEIMLAMGKAYFGMAPRYEFATMARLNRLFELLLQDGDWIILSSEQARHEAAAQQRLERIMQFVQNNYQQKLFLKQVAAQEHLSESYLTHFVQKHMNITFQDFVALTRFQHARQLLESTEMTVAEICSECGFSDRRYLNKICLQETGMTPKEYRRAQTGRGPMRSGAGVGTLERIYTDEEALQFLEELERSAIGGIDP